MPLMRSLTTEEIDQTIWGFTGPLSLLYGIAFPLGAIACDKCLNQMLMFFLTPPNTTPQT